jgi:peptidoglycan/LPS O-acetylase OafA/YrhL
MSNGLEKKSEHYFQIDALRAIAVIGVFLYHLGTPWMPGGFLGVDLFFVISGYVITRSLIDSINLNSQLDIKKFYLARIRRIYPGLISTLVVTSFLIFFLAKDAASRFLSDIPYVLTGVNNWRLVFLHQNYFAAIGRPPLLQQTWTLSVELQFYLIWPIILNFIWKKFGKERIPLFSLLISIISGIALALISLHADSISKISHIYFGTDTHAIGLFLGSALAVYWIPSNLSDQVSLNAKRFFTYLGLISLIGVILLFILINPNKSTLYQLAIPITAVTGAIAIFALMHPASSLLKYLQHPLFTWLGERSYGIYLWHWVILEITRPDIDLTGPKLELNLFRILIVFTLADFSYRYVELPFRQGKYANWWRGLKYRTLKIKKTGQISIWLGGVVIIALSIFAITSSIITTNHNRNRITKLNLTNTGIIKNQGTAIWLTGDSIVLGSESYLSKYYHLEVVNARVGRQIDELIQVVKADQPMAKGAIVVLDVGNNNILTTADLKSLLDILKVQPRIILINTAVPRSYRAINDQLINQIISNYPNLTLVDWNQISQGHPNYFAPDGVHLTPAGDQAYVGAILEAIKSS